MELKLDRKLADKRIFPAVDVDASGTRTEEILLAAGRAQDRLEAPPRAAAPSTPSRRSSCCSASCARPAVQRRVPHAGRRRPRRPPSGSATTTEPGTSRARPGTDSRSGPAAYWHTVRSAPVHVARDCAGDPAARSEGEPDEARHPPRRTSRRT